ncbi:hypothetical protein PSTG_01442 [Puccinia striiformis f. sp. tritici PST-78]|uniref:Uncharacterized protein n=1 Tax=Puccinia striiformis f. sp. tritici PST-78 TaxID=1165861 RepID=A0A0L0W113_9BASI|nr:hypothetical protein PSTG_01442 [Puccinia striiformis f. sp. tritici PST-78]
MASIRPPNHPVNVSGCFETLDVVSSHPIRMPPPTNLRLQSIPNSVRANQYGNVLTPSCVSCTGLLGDKADDVELTLTTNTALNNLLQPHSIYFLAGRLLSPNDGLTPLLTYQQTSLVRLAAAGPTAPDLANKAIIVGLDVVSDADDNSSNLHVAVQHSDWDSVQRSHRTFTVLYIVPGTKIFIKTHGLYIVGREIEVTGNLVDFDMENFTAIVSVNSVAVTTGHQIGRANTLATASPSGFKNGRKFKTFPPKKSQPSFTQPSVNASKDAFTEHSSDIEMPPADSSSTDPKGKKRANKPNSPGHSDSYDSDTPIINRSSPQGSQVRLRPNILQDTAKRLKRQ